MFKINFISKDDLKLLKRTKNYILKYKFKFIISLLCIFLGVAFTVVQPLVWASLLASLFENQFNKVGVSIGYLVLLFFAQTVTNYYQAYLFQYLSNNLIHDIKMDMFRNILHMPIKLFDEIRVGDLISRLEEDTSAIAYVLTNQFLNTIVNILKVVIIGITIFSISVPLSILVLLAFPFSLITFSLFGKKLREKNKEVKLIRDKYFSNLEQNLLGIKEIRSLGIMKYIFESLVHFLSI